MTDALLERLTYQPAYKPLQPIPFPKDTAPTPVVIRAAPDVRLPAADAVVMTFTVVEGDALADVLSPGHRSSRWLDYTHDFASYEPHLTHRSPARDAGRLGSYAVATIGSRRVLLFKSELHPATDDVTMPLRALWRQIITETGCKLAIDTGTAGGVGADIVVGDVLVTNSVQLNYAKLFAHEPFATQRFVGEPFTPGPHLRIAGSRLIPTNADKMREVASRYPTVYTIGDCQSVDYFAFADAEDAFGILKADASTRMEEMDVGALVLACEDLGSAAPRWLSSRCASDPQVPQMGTLQAEKKWAANIYRRFGYYAAVGSVLACWGVIADM